MTSDRIANALEHIRTSRALQGHTRETIKATLALMRGCRPLGIQCDLCGDGLREKDDLTSREDKLVHTHCDDRMRKISAPVAGAHHR